MRAMNPSVTVREILEAADRDLRMHILAGHAGLTNRISVPRVQKPGLALAGFTDYVQAERVQVLGQAEMAYLKSLPAAQRPQVIAGLCRLPVACIIITHSLAPPRRLVQACEAARIPLLSTRSTSGLMVSRLTRYLEERLAECVRVHGVLVDVFGLGVLLRGKSGIGKSEAALDLIARGHRLVADDVVEIRKVAHKRLLAGTNERLGFHMEVRGLGIIDILDLFGITATRERIPIDLVVHMIDWAEIPNPDRTGLTEDTERILGVLIPMVHVPVRPGRNLATIIEVASRNEMLKRRGTFSALSFNQRVLRDLQAASSPKETQAAQGGGKKGGKKP
jgi:HPr kinase/phosphorylase